MDELKDKYIDDVISALDLLIANINAVTTTQAGKEELKNTLIDILKEGE